MACIGIDVFYLDILSLVIGAGSHKKILVPGFAISAAPLGTAFLTEISDVVMRTVTP